MSTPFPSRQTSPSSRPRDTDAKLHHRTQVGVALHMLRQAARRSPGRPDAPALRAGPRVLRRLPGRGDLPRLRHAEPRRRSDDALTRRHHMLIKPQRGARRPDPARRRRWTPGRKAGVRCPSRGTKSTDICCIPRPPAASSATSIFSGRGTPRCRASPTRRRCWMRSITARHIRAEERRSSRALVEAAQSGGNCSRLRRRVIPPGPLARVSTPFIIVLPALCSG